MRALRALAFSAAAFCVSLPLAAHANFVMNGDAQASTLPGFQSQASPSAQYTAGASNPANYYANTLQVANAAPQNLQPMSAAQQDYIKKQQAANGQSANLQPAYAQPQPFAGASYSVTPLPQNGADPGVGPVVIEGQNVKPVVIEGQPQPGQFAQVGYGYAPVGSAQAPAPSASNVPPMQPSSAAYSTQGTTSNTYGTQSATAAYGTPAQQGYGSQAYAAPQTQAPAYGGSYGSSNGYGSAPPASYGAQGSYGTQGSYGAQAAATQGGYGAAPAPSYAPQGAPQGSYGANSYGMSGYGGTVGSQYGSQPQASPGMLSGAAPQSAYGSSYGSSAPAYGSGYGSAPQAPAPAYGSGYGAAPQQAPAYDPGSNYGAQSSSDNQPYAQPTPYSGAVASVPNAAPPATPAYPNYGNATSQGYGASGGAYPGYGAAYNATPAPQPAYGYPAQQPQPDYGSPQGYAPPYNAPPQPAPYNYNSSSSGGDAPRYSKVDYATPASSSIYDNGSAVSLAAVPDAGHFYATIRTGLTFPQTTKFTDLTAPFTADYKNGWEMGGAVGYTFPGYGFINPRAELEVSEHMASVDTQTVGATKIKDPNAFGSTDTLRVFANGYLDINTPMRRIVTPYIGGGIGVGFVDYDRHGTTPSGVQLSDSDNGFAYNLGAGLSFPLLRGTTIDVGYRYSQVLGVELTALDGSKSKTDVGSHEITAGLRQRF